jgi:hypothetical protein
MKPTIDWSHKWQCFYEVRGENREQITHRDAYRAWNTAFTAHHWTPAAFRIMQEIVLA